MRHHPAALLAVLAHTPGPVVTVSDSNPVHPVDLHYATFLSLAVLVLLDRKSVV